MSFRVTYKKYTIFGNAIVARQSSLMSMVELHTKRMIIAKVNHTVSFARKSSSSDKMNIDIR